MKRYILPLALLVSIMLWTSISNAQCKFEKNEVDEFTGHINKQTKWERIAPKNVMAVVAQLGDKIGFLIAGDIGCVNDDSKAYFKFQDDTIIKIGHSGNIDCGDIVSLILYIDDYNLEIFATKPIAKIRLQGTEGNVDVPLNNPEYFVKILKDCFDVSQLMNQ